MTKQEAKKIDDALSDLARASMRVLQALQRDSEMHAEMKKIDEAIDELIDAFDEACREE